MKKSALLIILVVLAAGMLRSGTTVEKFPVKAKKVKEFNFLYYEFTGPYQKAFDQFGPFMAFLKKNNIETGDYYVGIYIDNPQMTEAAKLRSEIGVMVKNKVSDTGKYKMKIVEGFKAISTWYHSMEEIQGAWNALGNYLMTNGLIPAGPGYEFYRTDKDPSDFSAECFFPVKEFKN